MCTWGTDVVLRVPIPASHSYTGKFRWDDKPIDFCLAPIVQALNVAGIYTGGSCCGHGSGGANISLHDGRVLLIEQQDPAGHCIPLVAPLQPLKPQGPPNEQIRKDGKTRKKSKDIL